MAIRSIFQGGACNSGLETRTGNYNPVQGLFD